MQARRLRSQGSAFRQPRKKSFHLAWDRSTGGSPGTAGVPPASDSSPSWTRPLKFSVRRHGAGSSGASWEWRGRATGLGRARMKPSSGRYLFREAEQDFPFLVVEQKSERKLPSLSGSFDDDVVETERDSLSFVRIQDAHRTVVLTDR
jgi:hypothetical protein